MISRRKKEKMRLSEVKVLYHSLDIEKRELDNIKRKMDYILFVKEQLDRMGLETKNIDVLIRQIDREKSFSVETIQMLNTIIPEKVDTVSLQRTVNQFLQFEKMNFHELARTLGIPYGEFEMFVKTGNADSYLTMKIFEYFHNGCE